MGLEVSLIAVVVVSAIAFLVLIVYAILEHGGFLRAKNKVTNERYACLLDGDCGAYWGLDSSYICDPKLKNCRKRAYIKFGCTSDADCMQITPHCQTRQAIGSGISCTKDPHTFQDLYGESQGGRCNNDLVLNSHWNFCQGNLGSTCTNTDDCAFGACINTRCTFLKPFDVCTVGSSYGDHQCNTGDECAGNLLQTRRCQPIGIAPGQPGAYCLTDKDCDNKDCYREEASDPTGRCLTGIALMGMACRHGSECKQGLDCEIQSGQTSGECVLADPRVQTTITHCPPTQYSRISADGCVGAVFPVPCSLDRQCIVGCAYNSVERLVLGSIGADNLWVQVYPPLGQQDTANVFTTNNFTLTGGTGGVAGLITQNPLTSLLLSISQLGSARIQLYPPIMLQGPPNLPPPQPVINARACENIEGGENLLSAFSTLSASNILFNVVYNPSVISSDDTTSKVTAIMLNTVVNQGQTTPIIMASKDLVTDFLVNGNIYATPPESYNQIYVYHNFYGATQPTPWLISAGDMANLPASWKAPGGGLLGYNLTPPPLLRPAAGQPTYLDQTLRLQQGPPAVYAHFFYYPSPGERVVTWKFSVLPTQGSGGLNTLVGFYEVEVSPTTRKLVVSTLTLYQLSPAQAASESAVPLNESSSIFAYRLNPVYQVQSDAQAVYASVYSFTLIDFATNWPFAATLIGSQTTRSDTAGVCDVTLSPVKSTATMTALGEDKPESIPGWTLPGHEGLYPVFTPRAFTRVQSATTLRTFVNDSANGNTQWSSMNLFGSQAPSLMDVDMVVMGTAGASSIIGMLFVYSHAGNQPPQTLLITTRFGDCMPTSRYSLENVAVAGSNAPSRSYTFQLTADIEETGGGLVIYTPTADIMKLAFPSPQVALAPVTTQDISSWVTPPVYDFPLPGRTVVDKTGEYVAHHMRTSWGVEVFTASLIPAVLYPPVRFFRMPLSTLIGEQGSDDVWVWGCDSEQQVSMKCVPLFFNSLGSTVAHYPGKKDPEWFAPASTCPPSVSEVLADQDHQYLVDGAVHTFSDGDPWTGVSNISLSSSAGFAIVPIPLTGRLCETQGFQDGILYRARPYVFPPNAAITNTDTTLPIALQALFTNPQTNNVTIRDLQSEALAFASYPQIWSYDRSLPYIGVAEINSLLKGKESVHPLLQNIFSNDGRFIVWVGSESGVPMLPGGYRTQPCPVNPRAIPITNNVPYPAGCADYLPLAQNPTDRKPLQVCVVYQYTSGPKSTFPRLEMHLYDIRMTRAADGTIAAEVKADTIVQTNGGLTGLSPSPQMMSYPGFNGGPAVIYTPCSS